MNTGPHDFRTYEACGTYMCAGVFPDNVQVNFNYFVEYHGKSLVDQFFSQVNCFYILVFFLIFFLINMK